MAIRILKILNPRLPVSNPDSQWQKTRFWSFSKAIHKLDVCEANHNEYWPNVWTQTSTYGYYIVFRKQQNNMITGQILLSLTSQISKSKKKHHVRDNVLEKLLHIEPINDGKTKPNQFMIFARTVQKFNLQRWIKKYSVMQCLLPPLSMKDEFFSWFFGSSSLSKSTLMYIPVVYTSSCDLRHRR